MGLVDSVNRALMRQVGGKDVVGEINSADVVGVRVAGIGARDRWDRRKEAEVDLFNAEALAMMCPTLFLRSLKKAADLEKTEDSLGCCRSF